MPEAPLILIIDDEPGVCWALAELARGMGYAARAVGDAAQGLAALEAEPVCVVVLDIQLPGLNGLEALPRIKALRPDVPVVVITAHGTMETAVTAVQRGAFEYLLKPVDMATLKTVLSAAVERRRQQERAACAEPAPPLTETGMVGRCPAMQEVFKQIAVVSRTDMPVLIQGETGTGKELAARAIHRYSPRAGGPFVAVNCSLLSGDLIASALFGHEKGAFTGADRPVPGKVELAEGGTLLLDEVGDLGEAAQARMLRFLDDGEFYRVGSPQPRRADVRVLAATNRPLREAALAGQFRRDLFFRISAVTIELPPLRRREGDLDLLIDHFAARSRAAGVSEEARQVLRAYSFPGNVRELKNAVEHAAAMAGDQSIGPEHLGEALSHPPPPTDGGTLEQWARRMLDQVLASGAADGYDQAMARWERPLLEAALARFEGNQARLAAALNMHRSTLRKKLRAHGLIAAGEDQNDE